MFLAEVKNKAIPRSSQSRDRTSELSHYPSLSKKLVFKLVVIGLLLSRLLQSLTLFFYVFCHSLSFLEGSGSVVCYKWNFYSLCDKYLRFKALYQLRSLLCLSYLTLYHNLSYMSFDANISQTLYSFLVVITIGGEGLFTCPNNKLIAVFRN